MIYLFQLHSHPLIYTWLSTNYCVSHEYYDIVHKEMYEIYINWNDDKSIFYIYCNFTNIIFFPKSHTQKSKIELRSERSKIIYFYIESKALETNFKLFFNEIFYGLFKNDKAWNVTAKEIIIFFLENQFYIMYVCPWSIRIVTLVPRASCIEFIAFRRELTCHICW